MFEGFAEKFVEVTDGRIFCRIGGEGPPLLLLHGNPQTHVMWHKCAHELAQDYQLIIADLRGYGDSLLVESDPDHFNYSKRMMAKDMAELMTALGHETFFLAGHDRGGRVAHRLARDHRQRVKAMSVLDIAPTLDMYEGTGMEFATAYFHWFFLIQPYDLPERMIREDPRKWMDACLQKWSGGHEFGDAEEAYLKAFDDPARIHACCEDYRASATIDLDHDRADRDAKLDIPIHVLWGAKGVVGRLFEPLALWQNYTVAPVTGRAMETGHFIPEEDPQGTIRELKAFFASQY
ncbi:MAG: alpha/beta hydrolase [Alphaproteobacteria bacterium]|nr:alpha/beta hydrolase [Alphaproteobacteria bacterium]